MQFSDFFFCFNLSYKALFYLVLLYQSHHTILFPFSHRNWENIAKCSQVHQCHATPALFKATKRLNSY